MSRSGSAAASAFGFLGVVFGISPTMLAQIAEHWGGCCVGTYMGDYGPAASGIYGLIERAGMLTIDEAADLYRAHANRILIQGSEAERVALARARRVASKAGRRVHFEEARHAAASAWRHALPETQGPWLTVGAAIANAAGALIVEDILDDKPFQLLIGPWRQAIGMLTPMGPGTGTALRLPALARERIG